MLNKYNYHLLVLVIFINLLVLWAYGLSAINIIKILLTLMFATFIPGLIILKLLKITADSAYYFLLASIMGITVNCITFMLLSSIDMLFLIYPLIVVTIFIYCYQGYLKEDYKLLARSFKELPFTTLANLSFGSFLLLALIIIFYYQPNVLPGNEAVVYHVDYPWHIGNIAEILHHWYPQDPRLAGNPFHYHIFCYVYMACLSFISKISIPIIYLRVYIIVLLYLLMGGAYFAASRLFNSRRAGVVHVYITFFLGTALLSWPHNVLLRNFFISPTFLLAMVFLFPLISEMLRYLSNSSRGQLILVWLLSVIISGAKGSFFPIIWSALAITGFYCYAVRQPIINIVKLMFSSLTAFLIVYVLIFQGTGSEGINIFPLEILYTTALYKYFSQITVFHETIFILGIFLIYLLLFFSFRVFAFINLCRKNRSGLDKITTIFLVSIIFMASISGYLLSYRGTSQYYFLFVGFAVLNLVSAGYLTNSFKAGKSLILKIVLIIFIVFSSVDTVITINYQQYINDKFDSIRNKPLTPSMYAGLNYLRMHSPVNSIIAGYRSFWLNDEDPRYFYYSAFAERRFLVEGWAYMSPEYQMVAQERYEDIKKLFSTRDAKIAEIIIKQRNIDYILVDKGHKQKLRFQWQNILDNVYSNEDIEIYQYTPE